MLFVALTSSKNVDAYMSLRQAVLRFVSRELAKEATVLGLYLVLYLIGLVVTIVRVLFLQQPLGLFEYQVVLTISSTLPSLLYLLLLLGRINKRANEDTSLTLSLQRSALLARTVRQTVSPEVEADLIKCDRMMACLQSRLDAQTDSVRLFGLVVNMQLLRRVTGLFLTGIVSLGARGLLENTESADL